MIRFFSAVLPALLVVVACAGGPGNEWDDLDYSGVYRAYGERENDPGYKRPSVLNCVNEDLYNCQ